MWTTDKIRKEFLDFFSDSGHIIIQSSSTVPHDDPSLLFTAAGMVPFKNIFTGLKESPYNKVATVQKCIRAGGKHNDLENVGYTARHHTFFEMLGNFSFGDYFKEEAIKYSWELLTKIYDINPDKLLITVFHKDQDAINIWQKITGFSDNKILKISTEDNFWSMGNTGPCGPCSEIFYDYGDKYKGGLPGSIDENGDRFVEIWNLVFMQYEKLSDGSRVALPKPSIDTGAGLERLSAVLQGVHNNYDIDIFKKIISGSIDIIGNNSENAIISHRVIADHLRSSCFLIADGVLPSNEGRGYVLRRIMRRAMRHIYILGYKQSAMYKLVPILISEMGSIYPELIKASKLITEILYTEEEKFRITLGKGIKLLNDISKDCNNILPGDIAFKLYDTYGFPLDLTQDIMREKNITVDVQVFNKCMTKQRDSAREAWSGSGDIKDSAIWFELAKKIQKTKFIGYSKDSTQAKVMGIVCNGKIVKETEEKEFWAMFNISPFYAESGGQVGDIGCIKSEHFEGLISNCIKKVEGLFAHKISKNKGLLKVGEQVTLAIDTNNRSLIKKNHSATHLLHFALRELMGETLTQRGSLVNSKKLRFDFNCNRALTSQEIYKIEDRVNNIIQNNYKTTVLEMPYKEAVNSGAVALFGEKYDDDVRVISIGNSKELCGGTHVNNTGEIGFFHIIKESSVSAGIRRIEAVTGTEALLRFRKIKSDFDQLSLLFKSSNKNLLEKAILVLEENKNLKNKKTIKKDNLNNNLKTEDISGIKIIIKTLEENCNVSDLKPMCDNLLEKFISGIIIVGINYKGKGSVAISVSSDLTSNYSAADLAKIASEALGGNGGGRKDMAQAGGVKGENLIKAYDNVLSFIRNS